MVSAICYPYFLNVWSMRSMTVMQHIAQIYESYELTKATKSDVSMKTILWYNVRLYAWHYFIIIFEMARLC